MQDLVGQCFSLAEVRYRIVDVRNIAGESMIYAEKLQEVREHQPRSPLRAAFHYSDILEYLASSQSAQQRRARHPGHVSHDPKKML
jgi:hypothetical protein